MSVSHVVTPEVLSKFKTPFGLLIEGDSYETMRQLRKVIVKEKPPRIVSVGDTVTRNLHENQIVPHLSITDNQSMRKKIQPQTLPHKTIVRIENPQGRITQEAIQAVQEALQNEDETHIIVDGEEDLLTLIAVLYSPENTIVVYGQPSQGIVVVKVTPEKKAEAKLIYDAMETIEEK
jgi:GTP-dependent dephospho-CoA kinase